MLVTCVRNSQPISHGTLQPTFRPVTHRHGPKKARNQTQHGNRPYAVRVSTSGRTKNYMLLIMNICNVEMITIVGPYHIHVLCEILREIYIFSKMY